MFKKLVIGLAMVLMIGCATGSAVTVPKDIPNVAQEIRHTPDGIEIPNCGSRICFDQAGAECVNIVAEATGIMNNHRVLIQYIDLEDNYLPDIAVVFVRNAYDGFWYLLTDEPLSPEDATRLVNAYDLNFRICRNG
jgi:hypothetical protein